ncbi:MAG: sigma-70 family RNA polymerase sigma factor [Bacteroidales bacterium]|nr:sigma-70 family RNA polymerase sigma factor [Bacteroidales bacterium]MBD5377779.1 sigma-70 family RNA polymerase sigma factor [Bacteroides sp.]
MAILFSKHKSQEAREARFSQVLQANRQLICKVCYMYASDGEHFNDLYQEVVANIWQGLASYRGTAAMSTWIYRVAINTCVTFYRRHRSHSAATLPIEAVVELPAEEESRAEQLKEMYRLIATLEPMEKALILMWLDERSYDEISDVTGLSRNNVASRLRRIRLKLIEKGQQ